MAFDEWDLYIGGVSGTGGDAAYFGTILGGSASEGGTGVGGVLAVSPYQGRVYIGGSFSEWQGEKVGKIAAIGGLPGGRGEQLGLGVNGVVRALAIHDGLLVVAGDFTKAFHDTGAVDSQVQKFFPAPPRSSSRNGPPFSPPLPLSPLFFLPFPPLLPFSPLFFLPFSPFSPFFPSSPPVLDRPEK